MALINSYFQQNKPTKIGGEGMIINPNYNPELPISQYNQQFIPDPGVIPIKNNPNKSSGIYVAGGWSDLSSSNGTDSVDNSPLINNKDMEDIRAIIGSKGFPATKTSLTKQTVPVKTKTPINTKWQSNPWSL